MRILIAMDKFKGTATAAAASDAVARGILRERPFAQVRCLPMADGGDGTLDAMVAAGYRQVEVITHDAQGAPITARVARQSARCLIEVAEICGLGAQRPTASMAETADSSGVGEAVLQALDAGATELRIALGGSATSDGGAGILRALGARFLDREGDDIGVGGAALVALARIDWSGLDPRLEGIELLGLCDVDAPLLGAFGAAAVYGPQKGAGPESVARIEAGLTRFAEVVALSPAPFGAADPSEPGAGAAGGIGWCLHLLGGHLVSGGTIVAEALGLDDALEDADLVVTGEGRLDEQSFAGKTPAIVANAALQHSVPAVAIVGQDRLGTQAQRLGLHRVFDLADYAPATEHDPALTLHALELAGAALAGELVTPIEVDTSTR